MQFVIEYQLVMRYAFAGLLEMMGPSKAGSKDRLPNLRLAFLFCYDFFDLEISQCAYQFDKIARFAASGCQLYVACAESVWRSCRVDSYPLIADVSLCPDVSAEDILSRFKLFDINQAGRNPRWYPNRSAHRRSQNRMLGAIALFALRDFKSRGVSDGKVFLIDIIADEFFDAAYGLAHVFGIANGALG